MKRDPVCGMTVIDDRAFVSARDGDTFHFCSKLCKDLFDTQPEKYFRAFKPRSIGKESERRIAYFSMEIGIEPAIPTYSGRQPPL